MWAPATSQGVVLHMIYTAAGLFGNIPPQRDHQQSISSFHDLDIFKCF